jgi:hypothetical protein
MHQPIKRTVIIPAASWAWHLSLTKREEYRFRMFQNKEENMSTWEMKWQEESENYIKENLIISAFQRLLLEWQNEGK